MKSKRLSGVAENEEIIPASIISGKTTSEINFLTLSRIAIVRPILYLWFRLCMRELNLSELSTHHRKIGPR